MQARNMIPLQLSKTLKSQSTGYHISHAGSSISDDYLWFEIHNGNCPLGFWLSSHGSLRECPGHDASQEYDTPATLQNIEVTINRVSYKPCGQFHLRRLPMIRNPQWQLPTGILTLQSWVFKRVPKTRCKPGIWYPCNSPKHWSHNRQGII